MTPEEFYKCINGSYEEVFSVLADDKLILRFINRFIADDSYSMLMKAVQKSDTEACFEFAHRLKGVAANLGFTELYEAASDLSEQTRSRKEPAKKETVQKVKETYETLMYFINRLEKDGLNQ